MFRDLKPYICTYEYYTEADQQYDNITDWIAHEYHNHKDAMHYPGRIYSDDVLASQQEDTSRPPGLDEVCREQCPVCDEGQPSVSHVGHHLRKIAAFALPSSTIVDDIAPGSQDLIDANLHPTTIHSKGFRSSSRRMQRMCPTRNPPPLQVSHRTTTNNTTPYSGVIASVIQTNPLFNQSIPRILTSAASSTRSRRR